MAAAVLIAAAILAQQTSVPPAPPVVHAAIPAAAEAVFASRDPAPDVVALHAEIGSGPADPAWSAPTEAALSRAYHHAIDPSRTLETLDVTCNESLCEVLGVSRPNLSIDENNVLMDAFQARDLHQIAITRDLALVVQSFNQTRDDGVAGAPSKVVFVAYWRRAE